MASPRRLFFVLGLTLLVLGFSLEWLSINISQRIFQIIGADNQASAIELQIARYYWSTGRLGEAINEYRGVLQIANFQQKNAIQAELGRLVVFENTARGKLLGSIAFISWAYPPWLFLLAFISLFIFLGFLLSSWLRRKPILAILPCQNSSDLTISDEFSLSVVNRIREIVWQSQQSLAENGFIAENLDLPIFGMVNERIGIDSLALFETAVQFKVGVDNLPLTRLFNSLKMWISQPSYMERSFIHGKLGRYSMHLQLYKTNDNMLVQAWHINISPQAEEDPLVGIMDTQTYPLMHYFSKDIKARNWKSLCDLYRGMQFYQDFKNHNYDPQYLTYAKQSLSQALNLDPDYEFAQYNLGLILLLAGDYHEARLLLHTLTSDVRDQRLKVLAKYNYGVALFHLSQDWAYEKAVGIFEDLLSGVLKPEMETLIRSTLAVTFSKMACRSKKRKECLLKQAESNAKIVISSSISSQLSKSNAIAATGYIALARDDIPGAIKSFEKSVAHNPANISNWLGLAEAYIRCDQKVKAIDICKQAAKLSPNGQYSNYRIGSLYLQLNEIDQAREAFEKAPNISVARLSLGKILFSEMWFEAALEQFQAATALNKKLSEAWVNIAWTILEIGDPNGINEAIMAARRALQLEKNEDQLWHRHAVLSRALFIAKRFENAMKEAQIAVDLQPRKPNAMAQALIYLAQSQVELQLLDTAEKTLQQISTLHGIEEWQLHVNPIREQLKKIKHEKVKSKESNVL